MPIVLFDSSFYYLDSNNAAKTVFNDEPVEFNETEVYVNYAFCLSKYENTDFEIERNGRFYKIHLENNVWVEDGLMHPIEEAEQFKSGKTKEA